MNDNNLLTEKAKIDYYNENESELDYVNEIVEIDSVFNMAKLKYFFNEIKKNNLLIIKLQKFSMM
jgi:hypothetical protein